MNSQQKEIIWIAGGTGLIGRHLSAAIDKDRYLIRILSRTPHNNSNHQAYIVWDPEHLTINSEEKPDYIINLAGISIASKRWTNAQKEAIISSRTQSAYTIEGYLKKSGHRPKAYISASAVGYYGDRGDELLTEESMCGHDFMANCCVQWEEAAYAASVLCKKFVAFRISMVVSLDGGALPKILMSKSMGVFNYFGNGNQYNPWIHIDDLTKMFVFAIENPDFEGIHNAAAPQQITNKAFIRAISKAIKFKGFIVKVPAMLLRLAMGEMASVLLNSNRISVDKISSHGFEFQYKTIDKAITSLIKEKI